MTASTDRRSAGSGPKRAGRTVALVVTTAIAVAACTTGTTPAASNAAGSPSTSPDPRTPTTAAPGAPGTSAVTGSSSAVRFKAEVWADNWFSLSVNGEQVGEDSVPITTERSFNAETIEFTATYPFTIGMVTKDFKQDDSGLEYIGTPRQQMGDGGFIAQFTDTTTGRVVATTGAGWRGLVVHRAPTNVACEQGADPTTACQYEITAEPAGWSDPSFDDTAWTAATVYTPQQIGAKDGYDAVRWDAAASLIWSGDLKADNTVLWRRTVVSP